MRDLGVAGLGKRLREVVQKADDVGRSHIGTVKIAERVFGRKN